MKCPACGDIDDRVIDSRLGKDNAVIRRRRECLSCKKRFTTYERIEEIFPYVIKKDGRREAFDRRKIIEGMRRACEKRPISVDRIDFVDYGKDKSAQFTISAFLYLTIGVLEK